MALRIRSSGRTGLFGDKKLRFGSQLDVPNPRLVPVLHEVKQMPEGHCHLLYLILHLDQRNDITRAKGPAIKHVANTHVFAQRMIDEIGCSRVSHAEKHNWSSEYLEVARIQ